MSAKEYSTRAHPYAVSCWLFVVFFCKLYKTSEILDLFMLLLRINVPGD